MFATSPLMLVMLGILSVQQQLIGCIDDMMKLKKSTVSFNLKYPFTLTIKMCWSKTIWEEREFPVQMFFGSMDPLIFPLLNLVAFLEYGDDSNSTKLFGSCSNWSIVNSLQQILSSTFFEPPLPTSQPGQLGTHSIQKGSATYASRVGLPKVCLFNWHCFIFLIFLLDDAKLCL